MNTFAAVNNPQVVIAPLQEDLPLANCRFAYARRLRKNNAPSLLQKNDILNHATIYVSL